MNHRLIITLPDGVTMDRLVRHAQKAGYESVSGFIGACLLEKFSGPTKDPALCISQIEMLIRNHKNQRDKNV
jgi:hypothetical protein